MPGCSAASGAVAQLCNVVPLLGFCIYVMYMVVLWLLAIWLAVVLVWGILRIVRLGITEVRRLWRLWKEWKEARE